MKDVFIIEGLRTPIWGQGKSLKDVSAAGLAAAVITTLLKNNGLRGEDVDEVILGNAVGAGLGQNPGRQALIYAGLPFSVPAFTVNKVCGSGLKSVILGAQAIVCGDADIIIAGGAESASQCPYILPRSKKNKIPETDDLRDSLIYDGLRCSLNDMHMGDIAEYTAERFKITRQDQDSYALGSRRKAFSAQKKGWFAREIVPVEITAHRRVDADEKPREVCLQKLAMIPPAFKPQGTVTAGNSPAPADGAAVLLLASGKALDKFGLAPAARILGYATVAVSPEMTFTAPGLAVKKCLKASLLKMGDVDLFEITEAFAVQVLLTVRETGLDIRRLNIFGGAIALGHPLGASGARSLVTLINALGRRRKEIGVTSVCLGGGCGVSLAIRALH